MYVSILDVLEAAALLPLHLSVSLIGVVTNVLNMIVLAKLGFSNSVSIGTFALAFSDFYVSFFDLVMCLFFVIRLAYPELAVDLLSIGLLTVSWIRYPGYYISSWITALISIERCFSVVFPFRVKRVFTKTASTFFVLSIYIFFISVVIPALSVQTFTWTTEMTDDTNGTVKAREKLTVVMTEETLTIGVVIDVICESVMSVLSQVILIVCTVYMVYALKASSTVRFLDKSLDTIAHGKSRLSTLSGKERRLVKVVLCLAVVLTACNIPRYIDMVVAYTVPDHNADFRIGYIIVYLTDLFIIINCSSSFIVYFTLNSKFKIRLREMFGCQERYVI